MADLRQWKRDGARALIVTVVALLLGGCASAVANHAGGESATARPPASPSVVVYPPVGTAAIASDPICRQAHDPEVPAAKRSLAADECDVLLKNATERVTKPVSGPLPSASMTNPHAPACNRAELDARYAGGGDGGQTFYGLIVIWNSGAQACLLSGSARISATYADGAVDARVFVNGAPKVVDAYLPADTAAYDDMTGPASGRYLQALLAAPEFDAEPTCPQLSGPAAFTLSIGGLAFTVVNRDDDARQNEVLRGCQGDILLEGFGPPSA